MPNPVINQGTLNRLRGSVVIPDLPELNVTAEFLGDEGISIQFQGEATTFIPTLTGAVKSPEVYQQVTVSIHLLKTQFLASIYKGQVEFDSSIGSLTVHPDTREFPPYQFENCAIQSVGEFRINGKDAGYRVVLGGFYPINGDLWEQ